MMAWIAVRNGSVAVQWVDLGYRYSECWPLPCVAMAMARCLLLLGTVHGYAPGSAQPSVGRGFHVHVNYSR